MNFDPTGRPSPPRSPPPADGSAWPSPAAKSSNRPNTGLIVAIVTGFLLIVGGVIAFAIFKLAPLVQPALEDRKPPAREQPKREAITQLNQTRLELVAEMRRALDDPAGDAVAGSTERLARACARIEQAAKAFEGNERKAMEIVGSRLAEMRDKVQAYEAATTALKQAGFFAPNTLPTKDAINARRELTKQWMTTNDELARCIVEMENHVRADLESNLTPRDKANAIARFFATSGQSELNLKLRDYERQKAKAALSMLDLLQAQWGRWKVEANGSIRFNKEETRARFVEIQKTLTTAQDAGMALQKQFLEKQSRPSTPAARATTPATAVPPTSNTPPPIASPSASTTKPSAR